MQSLDTIAATYGFNYDVTDAPTTVTFDYVHPFARPEIIPGLPIRKRPPMMVEGELILRFGMIESDAVVRAKVAVYDPQAAYDPQIFHANGSTAERLACIMNLTEASRLTKNDDASVALAALLESCEVAIVKDGANGALVGVNGKSTKIPAYRTEHSFTIGSGDVFSAAFTYFWAIQKLDPFEAADLASLAVAEYVDSMVLPLLDPNALRDGGRSPIELRVGAKVYLAGPFFNLSQRWLVTEARALLAANGLRVLSPLHDVGVGDAHDVAPRDLEMLRDCDLVFAILDGSDEGTVYEVGYARAIGKPVICYTQLLTEGQLKMFRGSGCEIIDDFASAIAAAARR